MTDEEKVKIKAIALEVIGAHTVTIDALNAIGINPDEKATIAMLSQAYANGVMNMVRAITEGNSKDGKDDRCGRTQA